jgi:hypothetical protein
MAGLIATRNRRLTSRRVRAYTVITAAALLAGCASSSSLVDLWRSPQPQAPLRSVIVVSMNRAPAMRRIWEDQFVAELAKRGARARPSYELFPGAPPDTTELEHAIRDQQHDGIISIHRLANQRSHHYEPGYSTVIPYQRFNPWTGYYHTHFVESWHPGFVETDTIVRYEIDVWSPDPGRGLLWSGVTETIDPTSSEDVDRQVSRLIVPELERSGVVARRAS